jgi:hypothetical protein
MKQKNYLEVFHDMLVCESQEFLACPDVAEAACPQMDVIELSKAINLKRPGGNWINNVKIPSTELINLHPGKGQNVTSYGN